MGGDAEEDVDEDVDEYVDVDEDVLIEEEDDDDDEEEGLSLFLLLLAFSPNTALVFEGDGDSNPPTLRNLPKETIGRVRAVLI